MNAATTIGINPGTAYFAVAVYTDGRLHYYHLRRFRGKWSRQKLDRILEYLCQKLDIYHVSSVTVKVPGRMPLTTGWHQLIGSINVLCGRRGLTIRYYSTAEVCAAYETFTQKELMEVMARRFPDLLYYYYREQANCHPAYLRLFTAIATALMP